MHRERDRDKPGRQAEVTITEGGAAVARNAAAAKNAVTALWHSPQGSSIPNCP